MKTSSEGIELIKRFEGCRLTAYRDDKGYSVGYGHFGVAAGTTITQDEAEQLFAGDLAKCEAVVDRLANVTPLGQHQYDALVSLCYNIGSGNLQKSTVWRLIRDGGAAPRAELREAWLMWNKSGGQTLSSLTRRRNAEYDHYAQQDVLKKKTDADAAAGGAAAGGPGVGYHCNLK